jgi:hypothetical protein
MVYVKYPCYLAAWQDDILDNMVWVRYTLAFECVLDYNAHMTFQLPTFVDTINRVTDLSFDLLMDNTGVSFTMFLSAWYAGGSGPWGWHRRLLSQSLISPGRGCQIDLKDRHFPKGLRHLRRRNLQAFKLINTAQIGITYVTPRIDCNPDLTTPS